MSFTSCLGKSTTRFVHSFFLLLIFFAGNAGAEQVKDLKPQGYVNDFAGVLSAPAKEKLTALCAEVDHKAGAQISVVTISSLGGEPVEQFSIELATQWGVGPKQQARGILILLAPNDRKYRVEVGYGLEPILPDGKVGGFGREMVPLLRSNDYGGALTLLTERIAAVIAADRGVTLFAASGDSGSAQPTCDGSAYFKAVSTPASDPLVTAGGGTKLTADLTSGAYGSETTWNETVALGGAAAGGGGLSVVFKRPGFQDGVVDGRMRGLPDISYNAAVDGGVITLVGPLVFRVGGTSAGSPQWAGLAALADQLANGRVGQINPTLYRFGKSSSSSSLFHDVTTGDNALPAGFGGPMGFTATTGYDLATGWGSPIANNLVPALAAKGDDVRGGSDNQGGGGGNQGGGGGG